MDKQWAERFTKKLKEMKFADQEYYGAEVVESPHGGDYHVKITYGTAYTGPYVAHLWEPSIEALMTAVRWELHGDKEHGYTTTTHYEEQK